LNIIIAGGGTGGHIFPALAIARALQKKQPGIDVQFVGSKSGLEKKIIPPEGFKLHTISVGQLHKSAGLGVRIVTTLFLPLAFLQSLWIILRVKPKIVLGVFSPLLANNERLKIQKIP